MESIKAPLVAPTVLLVVFTLAGCAGNEPRSTPDVAAAQASIEQAERANAEQWAPRELAAARESLRRAEEAQAEGEEELAARLATRAELDAELAAATARNREAQNAVEELRATLDTLRRETSPGSSGAQRP